MAKDWERLRAVGKSAEKLFDEGKAYTDLIYVGKWIKHEQDGIEHLECDRCGVWFLHEHLTRNSFCPNCGADMREPR
jgi:predicted Zn-ribbon and HTH transcriptional regulator